MKVRKNRGKYVQYQWYILCKILWPWGGCWEKWIIKLQGKKIKKKWGREKGVNVRLKIAFFWGLKFNTILAPTASPQCGGGVWDPTPAVSMYGGKSKLLWKENPSLINLCSEDILSRCINKGCPQSQRDPLCNSGDSEWTPWNSGSSWYPQDFFLTTLSEFRTPWNPFLGPKKDFWVPVAIQTQTSATDY